MDLATDDKVEPVTDPEDLTAEVFVFPDGGRDGRSYDVLPFFFLPEAALGKKAEKDRADYLRWRDAGFLTITEGNRIDYDAVIAHVVALAERFDLQEVAIDRWNSTAVTTALQRKDITVATFGQDFASMAAPVRELKRAILGGEFRHGGNPVLRMCFANVVAEKDVDENEKFTKEKARGRIDGAVAAAMAVGRILAGEEGPSVYETADRPEGSLVVGGDEEADTEDWDDLLLV